MKASYTGRKGPRPHIAGPPAPGARLEIRGEEWILRTADRTFDGYFILTCTGVTPLVRDRRWKFTTEYAEFNEVDPTATQLIHDESSEYAAAKLHLESHLRITPPTDRNLYVANRGAMDDVAFQRVPVLQALDQPRPRILIADGTGLGKTLEAGMLMSELIRRGRGKRILIVTLKSMLTQFQKEMWTRFTIPLIRLDSSGINRVADQLPVGHNPFNHFDRTIISIDTLKINRQYKVHIEQSNWDIVVIDEAQNVARRGTKTLRHDLALLLADRSDALIMLSATPHDGRARSFASLINMLDRTVLTNPNDYAKQDFEGRNLFVRRFKKDIRYEVDAVLKERETQLFHVRATSEEEEAYSALADAPDGELLDRKEAGILLRTVLEKSVLSSPDACMETVRRRIQKIEKEGHLDPAPLENLATRLEAIGARQFSKYLLLLELLRNWQWDPTDPHDRIVIFSERLATIHFLQENLRKDLGLKEEAIRVLMGIQTDMDQQAVVEAFGSASAPVRILLSTDVGSEGINLHYHCYRLIHFDIPWSIMVLQQRNGRIDRYGQTRVPRIYYLLTESQHKAFKADQRILELLVEKERQAHDNIGDPASLMGVYNKQDEERIITEIIEARMTRVLAEDHLTSRRKEISSDTVDPLADLFDLDQQRDYTGARIRELPSLYNSDYSYLKSAMRFLGQARHMWKCEVQSWDKDQRIQITAPESMKEMVLSLPVDARPANGVFDLTANPRRMMKAIKDSIAEDGAWPQRQFLWPLHPIMDWATDKVRTTFKRLEAPVIMVDSLEPSVMSYIMSVSYPNRRGTTIFQKWLAVRFRGQKFLSATAFDESAEYEDLRQGQLVNRGHRQYEVHDAQKMLSGAVERTISNTDLDRKEFELELKKTLDNHLSDLKRFFERRKAFLDEHYSSPDRLTQGRKRKELAEAEKVVTNFSGWIQSTMQMGKRPYVEVIAVLIGR
ncbi:MAG: DEAD/DEAH box helicase [Bacteroidota bacterium]|nr:DEAD/DEAH box helicase [Bacteroidota bacterium]